MITHWSLLLALGLLVLSPALAHQDFYIPDLSSKAEIPGEEIYNELVDEVQKLHNQEINYLQYLGAVAARQQREEEMLQQQKQEQQRRSSLQQFGDEAAASIVDEIPAESSVKDLNRLGRLQELPKPLPYQKAKEEKKSNHCKS